ncbi:MAG: C10 family peptidase [Alistipes sp.]|nr:C10 family peptidase [Alistipes sp.]
MKCYTKLLYAAIVGLLFCACSSDPLPGPALPEATANPHAVSEEEALSRLEALLRDWDGEGTRSGGVRRIASVATVTAGDVCQLRTRGEGGDPVDNMFYLVNFEDGAGYAILGADDRLEPVYVIADEGSLAADRLHYAATVSDEQAEADGEFVYPLQLILDSAAGSIATAGAGGPISGIGGHGPGGWEPQPTVVDRKESDYVVCHLTGPLLKTKWHQRAPYNLFCPMVNGAHCVAGCGAIAFAQVLAYHAEANDITFNQFGSFAFDNAFWTNLKNGVRYPSRVREPQLGIGMTAETMAVGQFIYAVGVGIHADYGLGETSSKRENVANVFRNLADKNIGYKNVQLGTINAKQARTLIHEKKLPLWYRGGNSRGGHAWVLDGWREDQKTITTIFSNGTSSTTTVDRELVHANFGWEQDDRIYNGFYAFNVFDPEGAGPIIKTYGTQYTNNLRVITYELSK